MENERLHIAVADQAKAKEWKNTEMTWPELAQRLSEVERTKETMAQYEVATTAARSKAKDVGGYVGGYLANGKRNPRSVTLRSIVTLDVDSASLDAVEAVAEALPYSYVLHSTHSHTAEKPRYRLILPLDRTVTAAEYVPIGRRLAEYVGIEMFDETGYQPFRLMFWPSCSKDAEFIYEQGHGELVPADLLLDTYVDFNDVTAWPTSKKFAEHLKRGVEKQADPLEKPGVIGAFCRTYDIHEAIETFLQEEYTRVVGSGTGEAERYTYTHGSTAGGLMVYDDKFTFSHHGTDPTSGMCVNAYDLVRIHKFGDLDTGRDIKKSMAAMNSFAYDDVEVAKTMAAEQLDSVRDMFGGSAGPVTNAMPHPAVAAGRAETPDTEEDDDDAEDPVEWMATLERNKQGVYVASATNLRIIFERDPNICNILKRNTFDSFPYIFPGSPWRKIDAPERLRTVDYSGLRAYVEIVYGISSSAKVDDALAIALETNTFHPVRDFLNAAAENWDGRKRIKKLLPEYMGAETNAYTAQAMKTWMMAAVGRIFRPGIKFDLVLTLVGAQGTGKSTFFSALGGEYFSDTFSTFQGKEAFESLQGAWIIEMAELSGMSRSSVEAAKHFITKCVDQYRPAYGRTVEIYKRQCVFGATTNEFEFLRDATGNRRFLPIHVSQEESSKDPHELARDPELVMQLWGEAVKAYRAGGKLYLTGEAHAMHNSAQETHRAIDSRLGSVCEYLDMEVPRDWEKYDTANRRMYVEEYGRDDVPEGAYHRQFITAVEVWTEVFKHQQETFDKTKSREVSALLNQVPGWAPSGKARRFGKYGKQRYYERT